MRNRRPKEGFKDTSPKAILSYDCQIACDKAFGIRVLLEKNPHMKSLLCFLFLLLVSLPGCAARETHRALHPEELPSSVSSADIDPITVVVGEFVNRSTYMNGIFADSSDRLGQQAKQILVTHVSSNPRITVVDRRNMETLREEARYSGKKQQFAGADAVITGAVTEFGRKETGTRSLGGIIHKTKTQTLYAKVGLSVVDVKTSKVVKTYQGAGEYNLTNKEVLGVGGYAGYDSTLADKVLNLAIMEAVQRTIVGRRNGEW